MFPVSARLCAVLAGGLRPLLPFYLNRRVQRGKEDRDRLPERYGIASLPRPSGTLLWLHAASVGESISALPLIERLLALNPTLHILITTGTVTSATLLAQKLPARALHQYVPLDIPAYAKRFLAHWRPDAALWLESELWPNLLLETQQRGIPITRLNARLTEKSLRGWQRWRGLFRALHNQMGPIHAIAPRDAQRLQQLGLADVRAPGNLKLTAPVAPANADAVATLKNAIGTRPVWLFANSHPGEDELALRIHAQLTPHIPDLLTLIVPRHPARAEAIATLLPTGTPRRSKGEWPRAEAAFYLGDSMGEMGLYYRAAGVVCVGGSFTPKGGHNPVEPAQCGCAVIIGPDTSKCEDLTALLAESGALQKVQNEAALYAALQTLLQNVTTRSAAQQAALRTTNNQAETMAKILEVLTPTLSRAGIVTA